MKSSSPISHEEQRSQIIDVFYQAGLEHLIQDDDGAGHFCETCQALAKQTCWDDNRKILKAIPLVQALLQTTTTKLLEDLEAVVNTATVRRESAFNSNTRKMDYVDVVSKSEVLAALKELKGQLPKKEGSDE